MATDVEKKFTELLSIMKKLRAPGGCPWDREQTHQTLTKYCMEEAFEVVDAIDQNDPKLMCEELGDLLLQVVFHAEIAENQNTFTMQDILQTLNDKLVRRHPHVFPQADQEHADAKTAADVVKNWEEIKKKEGKKNVVGGVPKQLPALLRAMRLGEKAAQVGFDWEKPADVFEKVKEELREVEAAQADTEKLNEELGDLLFAISQYARHHGLDAELALRGATQKFERRFTKMEELAGTQKQDLKSLNLNAKEDLWLQVKKAEV